MKMQTSLNYETLASALGLERGLVIDLVEVDRIKGRLTLVVSGDVPSRTVTQAGFYPSQKHPGCEPDAIHINYLTRKDPS